jgi:CxxC-x17-CxxC domain-containing protein
MEKINMKEYKRKEPFGRDRGPRREGGKESFKAPLFKTTCNHCGKDCEVPFKPNGSKPVYCSTCFNKDQHEAPRRPVRGPDERNYNVGNREHGFSDRHAQRPDRSRESGAEGFRKELEALHHKLDSILAVLDTVVEKLNPIPPETVEEVPAPAKKTRKTAEKEAAVKKPLRVTKKAVPQPAEEEDDLE